MKILAFTDIHGGPLNTVEKRSKEADILACTGDFTIFGRGMKKIMAALGRMKKEVIIIHGNHEEESEVAEEAGKYKNIHFIHRKSMKYGGYEFIGYGGGGFALHDREFEKFVKRFEGRKNLILLTHAPPHGTKLDRLPFGHCGNKSYTGFIRKAKPSLVICGHIHENELEFDKIGKTAIINPGHHGLMIEI